MGLDDAVHPLVGAASVIHEAIAVIHGDYTPPLCLYAERRRGHGIATGAKPRKGATGIIQSVFLIISRRWKDPRAAFSVG